MRKRTMRLFCLILAAVLLMPLVYDDAQATARSWTFNQYEWQYYMIHSGYYEAAASVTVTEGVVPQGMSVLIEQKIESAVFAGSATSYGNFFFVVRVDCLSGDWYSYEVNALVQQQQIIDAYTPPSVTKNPTSETTSVGGSVTFISRATDTDACIWYITNGSDTYECQYAPHVLDGIRVSGQGTERLTLSNVPAEINGWSVYCAFSGAGGETLSKAATITVRADEAVPSDAAPSTSSQTPGEVQPPRITRQPEGLTLAAGKTGTLRVEAEAPPGAKVYYQWYCVTDGDGWEQMVSGGTGPDAYRARKKRKCRLFCDSVVRSGKRRQCNGDLAACGCEIGTGCTDTGHRKADEQRRLDDADPSEKRYFRKGEKPDFVDRIGRHCRAFGGGSDCARALRQ